MIQNESNTIPGNTGDDEHTASIPFLINGPLRLLSLSFLVTGYRRQNRLLEDSELTACQKMRNLVSCLFLELTLYSGKRRVTLHFFQLPAPARILYCTDLPSDCFVLSA